MFLANLFSTLELRVNMKYGKIYETSIGEVLIIATDKGICEIKVGSVERPKDVVFEQTLLIRRCYKQLEEYFCGRRKKFDIDLDFEGTAFQKRVWNELRNIPYGETRSYKDIATALGVPKGSQAVGQANKANPIPIIVPCHRVVNQNGSLGGYAYGLEMKSFLLFLEKRCCFV